MDTCDYLQKISIDIGTAIALHNPVMELSPQKDSFSVITDFLSEYVPSICGTGDPETDDAIDAYLQRLYVLSKALNADFMEQNPYIQKIHFQDGQDGRYILTNTAYQKGEILQYDFPEIHDGYLIPKIGYFQKEISFPTICEGDIPWMSVIPSEIYSMRKPIEQAHGNLLILGLGLGYYLYMTARKDEVDEVTVVESSAEVIHLFNENIFPQFDPYLRDHIAIVQSDAYAYLDKVKDGTYDFLFADIWEGQRDGHEAYERLKPYEKKLPHTQFAYWIEDYIK